MEKTSNFKRSYICLAGIIIVKALILIFATIDLHLMVEYVSYAFDAFAITYIFYEIDKNKERNGFLRGLGVVITTVIFMVEMFVTNLFVTYFSCTRRLGYKNPQPLRVIFEKDIEVYKTTGNTPYHLAAIFMLILCIAAIIVVNKDRKEAQPEAEAQQ